MKEYREQCLNHGDEMIQILNDKPHIRHMVMYGHSTRDIPRLDRYRPKLVEFCKLRGCLIEYSYWVGRSGD